MKRKIFIFIGLFAILLSAFSIPVNAQSNTAFYTNANGATLTEEQYNYLIDFFSETTLYTMTAEQLNFVKNETNLTKTTETKYIKTDEFYDRTGNLIERVETELSEEEALNYEEE